MSQSDKAAYYNVLKEAGVEFTKHYRDYSTDELAAAYQALRESLPETPEIDKVDHTEPEPDPVATSPLPPHFNEPATRPPVRDRDPNELPAMRLNTHDELEPIRTDEHGRIWYQEEVRKPAIPKPRGRRVLTYNDPGTRQETIQSGQFTETFEVAGDRQGATGQIKITLPSYQVGIYKDPRYPFKIHVYNDAMGFDLFEVMDYYGGSELVPDEIKRVYVSNSLCYDIRTTIRAIQTEYRTLQLQGKI